VPFQPTPTIVTLPDHFLLAASTEGASPLQVTQYGAQNQKATGDPTYREPRSRAAASTVVWPATTTEVVAAPTAATDVADSAESCAQPPTTNDAASNNKERGARFTSPDAAEESR
jgi:hypothetical protein